MKIVLLLFTLSLFSFSKGFEYFIQVASTKKVERLDYFKKIAIDNNLNYITKERIKKDTLYFRLLIGPYKTRDEAKIYLSDLKKIFDNKSAYISRFRKNSSKIDKIKKAGHEAYINRNFTLMNKYLEEAASLGDDESIYYIGKNYHHAIGIKQNIKKAIYWYEKCQNDNRCFRLQCRILARCRGLSSRNSLHAEKAERPQQECPRVSFRTYLDRRRLF